MDQKTKEAVQADNKKKLSKAEMLRRKENRSAWLKTICAVLVIAIVIGGFALNDKFVSNGVYKRAKITATSPAHKVTGTMMSYFFYSTFTDFYSQYYSYIQYGYINLSTTTSLKLQTYDKDTGETWYEYFLDRTKTNVSYYLSLSEKAADEGMTLGASDTADIDATVEKLRSTAADEDKTLNAYLSNVYGKGVTEKDVRACLQLETLANKYYNAQMDALSFTDDEINTYYTENAKKYQTASYRSYAFAYGDSADIATAAEASKLAVQLAACTTDDAYDAMLRAYLSGLKNSDGTAKYTSDEIETKISGSYYKDKSYTADDAVSEWVFDSATKVGDTKKFDNDADYTVCLLNTLPARNEKATVDVRHILLKQGDDESDDDFKARAEKLYAEWQAGPATEESFAELAKANSEDTGSADNGGLYENVTEGSMVDEFDSWCYDGARKAGDTGLVKSSYGYHIMYFVGFGDPHWKVNVRSDMTSDRGDELVKQLETDYPVKFHDSKISSLVP